MNTAQPQTTTPTAIHALIAAAGHGQRAGTVRPKQFQPLAGRPVLAHTLAAFAAVPQVAQVLVVLAPGESFDTQGLAPQRSDTFILIADCGGPTRADSVLNGLNALLTRGAAAGDWVLVHDAARCLLRPAWVTALIDACLADPVGGLLALPVADTLKRAAPIADEGGLSGGERVAATVPREQMWQAQTPQMFRLGPLRDALSAALSSLPPGRIPSAHAAPGAGVTDEASAMEAAGHQPLLVPGHPFNIKVTWPADFALAEALLRLDLS